MSGAQRLKNDVKVAEFPVHQVDGSGFEPRSDKVVVEEPMEIRVVFGDPGKRTMRSLSVTMRTPGNDQELAAGFLFTEGILNSAGQIERMETRGVDADGQETGNIVRVDLQAAVQLDFRQLQRNFFTTSSCGVCGKASLEALEISGLKPVADEIRISAERVHSLPDVLRTAQPTFSQTGGLHAAAIFDASGELLQAREDVGRHNAVDKLIGRFFLDGKTPLANSVMIISGRASFEIMQKALVAGLPIVIAVGAPSSLAVELAQQYNMTLLGFASRKRFNIYTNPHRIQSS